MTENTIELSPFMIRSSIFVKMLKQHSHAVSLWRQRGRVVRAPDLKSVGRGFKSRSDC